MVLQSEVLYGKIASARATVKRWFLVISRSGQVLVVVGFADLSVTVLLFLSCCRSGAAAVW